MDQRKELSDHLGKLLLLGWEMRNESCEECEVPLMKNKAGEMFCVSCHNYYTLKDNSQDLVFLRKGPPPKELGIRIRKEEKAAPATSISPPPKPEQAVVVPKREENLPAILNQSTAQQKAQIIETLILPGLKEQLSSLCSKKPENCIVGEDISKHLKNVRAVYEEICRYVDECMQLKNAK